MITASVGTVDSTGSNYVNPRFKKLVLNWTSTAGGAVTAVTDDKITGRLIGMTFEDGAATPTTGYNVVITDSHGTDVLAGQGANIASGSDTQKQVVSSGIPFPPFADTVLTLSISSAGASKNGRITLIIES